MGCGGSLPANDEKFAQAGLNAMDEWLAMLRRALETNYARLDDVLAGMQPHASKKGRKR